MNKRKRANWKVFLTLRMIIKWKYRRRCYGPTLDRRLSYPILHKICFFYDMCQDTVEKRAEKTIFLVLGDYMKIKNFEVSVYQHRVRIISI